MNHTKRVLDILFHTLESMDIGYCVLHSYETLPDSTVSDVDIAIDPAQKDALDSIISQIASEAGFIITQKLYYDIPHCYYYVLVRIDADSHDIVQLDFLMDTIGVNSYFFTSDKLLANRIRYKNFYVPAPATEFIYLLYKKIVKGLFFEEHRQYLHKLYEHSPSEINRAIAHYFGEQQAPLVQQLITADSRICSENIHELRRTFGARNISMLLRFQRVLWLAYRILKRLLNPTGMVVVILSPDGGGKTSVAKGILRSLSLSFRKMQ